MPIQLAPRTRVAPPGALPSLLLASLLLAASPALATEPVRESWSLMRIEGTSSPLGMTHERLFEEEHQGSPAYRLVAEMLLRIRRLDSTIEMKSDTESIEDRATGQLLAMTQSTLFSSRELRYSGRLEDGVFHVETTQSGYTRKDEIPWSVDILGTEAQTRRMTEALREGRSEESFKTFTFDFSRVATVRNRITGREKIRLGDEELLTSRVESIVDVMPDLVLTSWYDVEGALVRSVVPMAGNFILERSTREEVERFLAQSAASAPELLMGLAARPDIEIPRPYKTTGAVYRLTLKNGTEFPPLEGGSQRVTSLGERGVLLRVTSLVPPEDKAVRLPIEPVAELAEYLEPSVFVPCDDERIVKVARGVLRGESDAWSAAKKLETWVQRNIRTKSLSMGLAPPVEALETGEGDCTEHAMLLAALCRSIGIPSRVAVGLLYFQGSFAGHMWTEICLGSEWYPLDAILAEPVVDSARIRFSSSSLSGSGTSDAFQGVSRLLGNLDIEVHEIAHGDKVWRRESGAVHSIDGRTLTSTLYGVSFTAPAGCSLEKSERGLVQVMTPSGSRIAVSALDLTGVDTLEASVTAIIDGDRVMSRSESMHEGRRRIRIDIERSSLFFLKSPYIEELILDGDTLLRFSMKVKDEARDGKILTETLESLAFDHEAR